MRLPERSEHLFLPLRREDRLEPELGDAFLAPRPPHVRRSALAAEEGARPLSVEGAALVVADPSGAGGEERLARHEHDKLAVHGGTLPALLRSDRRVPGLVPSTTRPCRFARAGGGQSSRRRSTSTP